MMIVIVKKRSHQKLHQYKINNLRLNLNDVGFRGKTISYLWESNQ